MTPLKVEEERAYDTPKSNSEGSGEDGENDKFNCNTEILKDNVSAAAHSIVALSLNQGLNFNEL